MNSSDINRTKSQCLRIPTCDCPLFHSRKMLKAVFGESQENGSTSGEKPEKRPGSRPSRYGTRWSLRNITTTSQINELKYAPAADQETEPLPLDLSSETELSEDLDSPSTLVENPPDCPNADHGLTGENSNSAAIEVPQECQAAPNRLNTHLSFLNGLCYEDIENSRLQDPLRKSEPNSDRLSEPSTEILVYDSDDELPLLPLPVPDDPGTNERSYLKDRSFSDNIQVLTRPSNVNFSPMHESVKNFGNIVLQCQARPLMRTKLGELVTREGQQENNETQNAKVSSESGSNIVSSPPNLSVYRNIEIKQELPDYSNLIHQGSDDDMFLSDFRETKMAGSAGSQQQGIKKKLTRKRPHENDEASTLVEITPEENTTEEISTKPSPSTSMEMENPSVDNPPSTLAAEDDRLASLAERREKLRLIYKTPSGTFACPLCEHTCKGYHPLRQHFMSHTGFKYKCLKCKQTFRYFDTARFPNLLKHKGCKPCKASELELSSGESNSQATIGEEKQVVESLSSAGSDAQNQFMCFFCWKNFDLCSEFKHHLKYEHDVRQQTSHASGSQLPSVGSQFTTPVN